MLKFLLAVLFVVSASTGAVRALAPCGQGQSEMSVEGVEGIYCVDGTRICIANISDGVCPPKQEGLPFGSYCELVATNVYGCKALTAQSILTYQSSTAPTPTTATPSVTPTPTSATPSVAANTSSTKCPDGGAEMSVEGVQGIFCVKGGPLCVADVKNGLCPGIESPRLPLGSSCGVVASGVYGCKVAVAEAANVAPTAAAPQGASSTPSPTTAISASSTGGATASSAPVAPGSNCPAGESEVSVEGVKGFFCITEDPICSGSISNGVCPGKSDRLPIGSYCGVVASGVYGCKILNSQSVATLTPAVNPASTTKAPTPSSAAPTTPTPTTPAPTTSTPTPSSLIANTTASTSAPASADCPNGGTPMSIVGCTKIFCVTGDACAGKHSTGNCPAADAAMGLPKGSYCDIVRPGVYGCKPIV